MKIVKFIVIGLAIVLSGCATGIKQRDMAASIPTLRADKGRIYFFRSASMLGAALQPDVMLDGVKVGESKPGGFFFVDDTPGNHEVTTTTEVEKKLTFTLDKGETKYVKTSIGLGIVVGRVIPELVSASEAEAELPDLSFTGVMPGLPEPTGTAKSGRLPAVAGTLSTKSLVKPGAVGTVHAVDPAAPGSDKGYPQAGETWTYELTDRLAKTTRSLDYRIDRFDPRKGHVIFNQGARIEDTRGNLISSSSNDAGSFDVAMPPGGWAPLPLELGRTWRARYVKQGQWPVSFNLTARVAGEGVVVVPAGRLNATRIEWRGYEALVPGSIGGTARGSYKATVWYSKELNRVVKFIADYDGPMNTYSGFITHETLNLVSHTVSD